MKKFLLLFGLLLATSLVVKAQYYVRQICPNCIGNGQVFSGYYDYYGYPIFVACPNCGGYGVIAVPVSSNNGSSGSNVSFKSKEVHLKSAAGGKSYGWGTYYPESNIVVLKNGTRLNVTDYSDVSGYNRMIVFDDGTKWYFKY